MSTPYGGDPNAGWQPPDQPSAPPPAAPPPAGSPPGFGQPPQPAPPAPGYGQPDYSQVQPNYGQPYGGAPAPAALAGFWIRVGGALLDALILLVPNILLQAVLGPFAEQLAALILTAAYFIYLHGTKGQSIGQKIVSVKVIDQATGGPIDFARAGIRWAVSQLASIAVLFLGPFGIPVALAMIVGYLWMLWDPAKQTWHDKAAKTVVVKTA